MKKLNFISILLLATVLLFGCNKELEVNNDLQSKVEYPVAKPDTRIVSSEQAKAFAEMAVGAINNQPNSPLTRSSERVSVSNIEMITNEKGTPVLYAINLGENQGYMIISADKESPTTMLAYSDKGTFNKNDVIAEEPMGLWIYEQTQKITDEVSDGINQESERYQMWEYINGTNPDVEIELEITNFDEAKNLLPTTRGTHKGSWGLDNIAVSWVVYKMIWGQGRGYNADAPRPNVDLAGCPAVAAGILCRYHLFPNIYEYNDMSETLNTSESNPISRMFRDIANRMPGYSWSPKASGAKEEQINTGLRSLGYTDVTSKSYNFNTVYNNIKNNKPVLLGGFTNSGGHIWIADGYWEQTWKITKKFLGIKIKTWYEYQDHLYMNWGWNGSHNAWVDQASWPSYNNNRRMWVNLYPVR